MKNRPGIFIDIEGTDGCGKGTQAALLAQYFRAQGEDVVHTREPGGTPAAELIRNLILKGCPEDELTPLAEVLLFSAARAQHVDKLIRPSLDQGKVVISERFYPSTIVYQHHGRGVDMHQIFKAIEVSINSTHPDIFFVLDLPVEVGLQRKAHAAAKEGAPALDRFEREKIDFQQRLRNGYQEMARNEDRFVVLDATKPVLEVHQDIVDVLIQKGVFAHA